MRWENFVEHIRDVGYEGDGDDFNHVVLWLKRNKHDHEKVVNQATGEAFELRKLYDDRPGKPLDISKAAEQARIEEEIDRRLEQRMTEAEEVWGPGLKHLRKPEAPKGGHDHSTDVRWRKDRIVDDPKAGYPTIGHFLKDVQAAGSEQRHITDKLAMWQKASASTISTEGTGADGGFAAPIEMRNSIEQVVQAESSILGMTRQIPISGTGVSFPANEATQWGSSGIQAYWEGETGTYAQSKVALELKELKPRKVTALCPVTDELLDDATALGAFVSRDAGEKLDFKVGEAIFRGTGAGQPLGFLNAGSLISVTKATNQAQTTFLALNALNMWMRLYAPFRTNAVWFINQDVETELYRMSISGRRDSGGADSNWGAMIYIPPGGMSQSPYGTLMGRPVIPTQHCSTLGQAGDVCLCAMDQYVTAIRGGLESMSSIHLWFDQDITAFKFRMRLDGQPWLNSTISPRAGSNTMSAFITTAVRA